MSTSDEEKKCSFCGKTIPKEKVLVISKTGAKICQDCAQKICQKLGYLDETPARAVKTTVDHTKGKKKPAGEKAASEMTPSQIKAKLDEYVIGQEDAKETLSVAVYNHYKRLRHNGEKNDVEIKKSNVLLVGPTGSGKTYLAQTLAKILDVPFAIADASSMTQSGYVGEDATSAIDRLISAADDDLERAAKGIIYIDEIDKIASAGPRTNVKQDVAGAGVQQELLKMLEGMDVRLMKQTSPMKPPVITEFSTKDVLFICGGAFEGIEDYSKGSKSAIGFGNHTAKEEVNVPFNVTAQDVVKYGLMPELVGRLPIIAQLDPLDREALISILTEPKDAITRQYSELLRMDGLKVEFQKEALEKIADEALKRKSGARGLRAILEKTMKKTMFRAPDVKNAARVVVTAQSVIDGKVRVYGKRNEEIKL